MICLFMYVAMSKCDSSSSAKQCGRCTTTEEKIKELQNRVDVLLFNLEKLESDAYEFHSRICVSYEQWIKLRKDFDQLIKERESDA